MEYVKLLYDTYFRDKISLYICSLYANIMDAAALGRRGTGTANGKNDGCENKQQALFGIHGLSYNIRYHFFIV